jgi:hypothetical protein
MSTCSERLNIVHDKSARSVAWGCESDRPGNLARVHGTASPASGAARSPLSEQWSSPPGAAVISLIGAAVLRHEPIRLIIDSAITMQRKMLAPRA